MTQATAAASTTRGGARRWWLVLLGVVLLVAALALLLARAWSVDLSSCSSVQDSIELLDCGTTRWNLPVVLVSALLAVAGLVMGFRGLRSPGP